jgi:hypothetical protein
MNIEAVERLLLLVWSAIFSVVSKEFFYRRMGEVMYDVADE